MYTDINKERKQRGISPLTPNKKIESIIIEAGCVFNHDHSKKAEINSFLDSLGYFRMGENVGGSSHPENQTPVQMWMKSQAGHREAILDKRYAAIGCSAMKNCERWNMKVYSFVCVFAGKK